MSSPCIFCTLEESAIAQNGLAYAIEDRFPAAAGHSLIIPRRHILTVDELTERETLAVAGLLKEVKEFIRNRYGADGFTIGINEGETAGQTVMHLHIHIIPRSRGDVADPRGGIRKVLPCRRRYGE
ncbi:MAG: HIT family protein [Bacillota bacterium]